MRKYVGFGRLYGIVRDIFIVPETVVPDSMEGRCYCTTAQMDGQNLRT